MWLVAQTNPAIAPFALTFDPAPIPLSDPDAAAVDTAAVLIEAVESAFQLVGVGLFAALLARDRRYAGGAVLLAVGAALLIKGIAAFLLLKPAVFESWLSYGVLLGIAAGALLLLAAILLPRPAQVTICATALLSSLLVPLFVPDVLQAAAPLTLFKWRYGHLLNFNGLTRSILVAWPLAAALWLFALAGQPGWGLAAPGARAGPKVPYQKQVNAVAGQESYTSVDDAVFAEEINSIEILHRPLRLTTSQRTGTFTSNLRGQRRRLQRTLTLAPSRNTVIP